MIHVSQDERAVARPRQSMALSKELTNHSLPEIGDVFWWSRSHDCFARLPQD